MLVERAVRFGLLCVAVAGALFGCGPQGRSDDELVNLAKDLLSKGQPMSANLLLLEVRRPDKVADGLALLNQALEVQVVHPVSLAEGERKKGAELVALVGHEAKITDASFNQQGSQVVTASHDGKAIVWDANSGMKVKILRDDQDAVFTARFSPDDQRVVISSGRSAWIWDVQDGTKPKPLSGHDDLVLRAVYRQDKDHQWVVTASKDKTARIWDAATGKELRVFGQHSGRVTKALVNPHGTRVLTVSGQYARLWNFATREQLGEDQYSHRNIIIHNTAMFHPEDGAWVVTGFDDDARIWGDAPAESFQYLRGHEGQIQAAVFSHDGELVATASADNTARVWKVMNGKKSRKLAGHEETVRAVAFSPDKQWVVTASDDETIRLWHAESRREVAIFGGNGGAVTAVTFNQNGDRILTTSEDHVARIWLWTKPAAVARYLQSRIRARTSACLSESEWQEISKESRIKPAASLQNCDRCVSEFRDILGDARPHQWQVYLNAWDRYENCIYE